MVFAEKTIVARRGIGHDHAVSDFPFFSSGFRNHSGKFVAENGGRHDHFCVVAAFEDLEIGAAGERGFDADADFAGFERGWRNIFNLDFFLPVQDGGFHADSLRLRAAKAEEKFLIRRLEMESLRHPSLPDDAFDARCHWWQPALMREVEVKCPLALGDAVDTAVPYMRRVLAGKHNDD